MAAWQANAISRDTMTELFRRGEVLPEGRTNEEESRLIGQAGSREEEKKLIASAPVGGTVENSRKL